MSGLRLAIELSTRTGSVALEADGRRAERTLERARAHASDLLPSLDALGSELEIRGPIGLQLAAIFVGIGPGSYTGLRVAMATALGLARGSGAQLRGVPSFDVLAFGALGESEEGVIAVDARAGAYYFAHYRREANDVVALQEPIALSATRLRARWKELRQGTRTLVDAELLRSLELDHGALQATDACVPSADALLTLGRTRLEAFGAQAAGELEPLYLRAFGERPD